MHVLKKVVFLAVTILALSMTTQVALAGIIPIGPFGGYKPDDQITSTTPSGPHGGYATTTNKCKDCHAVHLASGSYRLTRGDTRAETCEYCHNKSNIAGVDVVLNEHGHGINTTDTTSSVVAPDDTIPVYTVPKASWGCLECHSVHDNQTVILRKEDGSPYASTKLLKKDPNPGKTYRYWVVPETKESTLTLTHWCSTCHNANIGSHEESSQALVNETTTTVYSHDSSGTGYSTDSVTGYALVNPDDGINRGPTCKQCHPSDGGNFPHSASAPNMLKSGTELTALDNVCSGCHNTNSLP